MAALSTAEQDGLAILETIKAMTGHSPSLGRLYTTLHRMEQQGLVTSRWAESTAIRQGARRRAYTLTPLGQRTGPAARPRRMTARPLTPGAVLRTLLGLLVVLLAPPGTGVISLAILGGAGYVTAILRGRRPKGHGRTGRVTRLANRLPPSIREPFCGDLCEQREAMRRQGYSRRQMARAVGRAYLLLWLHWGLLPIWSGLRSLKQPQVE
jgi:hypothetical protein